jgi:NADH-quinone oxidoreductase subunit N
MSYTDFFAALPIEIVSIFALIVMLADAIVGRSTRLCSTLSIIGLLAGIGAAVWTMGEPVSGFHGMIRTGGAANVFDIIFCGAGIMTVLLARDFLTRVGGMFDEFYTLLMMSVVGMMLMAHATDFMVLFVGLEVMSICFYVMAGLTRGELPSNEASLKYFLLGAFASGFLLYGIALVYGALGTTAYADMSVNIARSQFPQLLWAGVALLIVGLAFKVAAFPFHQWAPDVYTGAPTVVTSFMSTAGKAGAFAGFLGFMLPMLMSGARGVETAQTALALIAAGSMLIGNLTAIAQTNVKRMLAYSSIAHAGYLMIGLAAGNQTGATGILYYLGAYLFMQLGAFAIVGMLEREHGANLSIDDYRGLGRRRPGLAIVMALFMFSLVGLPPFAGFFGKYYLFMAAIRADMVWLAIVGVISSVISAWFYLGLIVTMFFREPDVDAAAMPAVGGLSRTALALTIAGTLIVGFIPELIIRVAR